MVVTFRMLVLMPEACFPEQHASNVSRVHLVIAFLVDTVVTRLLLFFHDLVYYNFKVWEAIVTITGDHPGAIAHIKVCPIAIVMFRYKRFRVFPNVGVVIKDVNLLVTVV
jgi:hypothetical protein